MTLSSSLSLKISAKIKRPLLFYDMLITLYIYIPFNCLHNVSQVDIFAIYDRAGMQVYVSVLQATLYYCGHLLVFFNNMSLYSLARLAS